MNRRLRPHSCPTVPSGTCAACQVQETARDEADQRIAPALRSLVAVVEGLPLDFRPLTAALNEAHDVLDLVAVSEGRVP